MSEAEVPNHSESNEPVLPQIETSDSGWVTVNLPNTIAVDAIPTAEPPKPQFGWRIQELEQQNQRLRSRVSNLELVLAEANATHRAETKQLEAQISTQQTELEQQQARATQLTQQQATMLAKQRQALSAARARLEHQEVQFSQQAQALSETRSQVVQQSNELDQAHQIQQKQQILIETLTQQLEASQAQVAQLERDCALTKQRYDEQSQFVRQTDDACRDLRSRLHRQQQYTLQFKTALEKCLDVAASKTEDNPTSDEDSIRVSRTETAHSFVKAPPVQPWSTTLTSTELDSSTIASLHGDVLVHPETPIAWATAPSEESLFEDSLPSDLDLEQLPIVESIESTHAPLSYTITRSSEEPLHTELQLFEPTGIEASIPIEPLPIEESAPIPIEPITTDILPEPKRLAPAPVVVASPFITLTESDLLRSGSSIELPDSGNSPAPIVYPQRSAKKVPSLAAIDLPSFGRSKLN